MSPISQALVEPHDGAALALGFNELAVFRATALLIVLTLVADPTAAMLCKVWCDPAEAAAQGCHHADVSTSAALTGTDDCDSPLPSGAVFVSEAVPRSDSPPDTHQALAVAQYLRSATTAEVHVWDKPGHPSPVAQRPLVTPLRI
jgi:hypothetical protein